MNKKALTKHDIYRKLTGFSEQDLQAIAGFIDSMQQKKRLKGKKLLKLEGSLKGCDIDFSGLKQFREQTWQHVEQESEMDNYVTDTQALVKFMMGKKVINEKAHQAFLDADKGRAVIIIPAIVLMEMLYLFEKHRISISLFQTDELLKSQNYQFEPLSLEILRAASGIEDIPEMHDRLIAATACYLDLPLITNDPVIRGSRFVTILE